MAYYEQSDSYYDYGDFQSDSRRNSNSFSEEVNGAKRKKSNWGGRPRGGSGGGGAGGSRQFIRGGGNRKGNQRNVTIDTPLFQEPKRTPPPPRRSPQIPIDRKRGRERLNPFRPANPKPYFDVREMPEFVEPEHRGPIWQWDNYARDCKNWQDKHKLAYYQSRCTALEFENQMLFEQINQLIKENIVFAAERGKTPTMEVPEIPGFGSQKASGSKNQGKNSQTSAADSEIEFNLTEDVVDYLETNIRHKLTLKKQKIEKETASGPNAGHAGEKIAAPKKPGLKRKEELDQLYGKNSALIQGLETSLQLNFNRICDTFKPEVYPAAPVNPQTVVV